MSGEIESKVNALKARQVYRNKWQVELSRACCQRPGYCMLACFCGPCVSYSLRKQALYGDMSRYVCCNGLCPCSGRCGESRCPGFCLCLETWLCTAQSVATTRFMIMDELRVETTKCDNAIIATMIVLQYVSCVCYILACFFDELRSAADLVNLLADVCWCSVCACMQAQHKAELDHRDAQPRGLPPPAPGLTPPMAQMIPMGGQHQQQGPMHGGPTGAPYQPEGMRR